jgi:hypothetical protein
MVPQEDILLQDVDRGLCKIASTKPALAVCFAVRSILAERASLGGEGGQRKLEFLLDAGA